ncbi:citrate synthase [Collinsella sp. zg1085]|uniref:citrate synthase n=1 Tax=Collinsella sp. zg1085 TaxID=2844380 RepID=UPI001C0E223F|nr:citrate synthase [Collinsella sp. zg1085]QWT17956.1 citrate synthase [Collinsella sp. zg1085]
MGYNAQNVLYRFDDALSRLAIDFTASRQISPESERLYHGASTEPYDEELFCEHHVKRGLRNADGSGVVAGLTRISDVHGYVREGERVIPDEGKLMLRGYDLEELIRGAQSEDRFGYEELAYLLITGDLPRADELQDFIDRLSAHRTISEAYIKQFPASTVSTSIMNVLARAVLLLYAFDAEPDDISPEHEIDVAISLLSRLPRIAALARLSAEAQQEGRAPLIAAPDLSLSTAETILSVLRGDESYTHDEAMLLDVMLMLHAEHGGGNNSTFACRVLSSSATDAYSAYAAAIGSLKGPRHGGANAKVVHMHEDIRAHVADWENLDELAAYLTRILKRDAFDNSGLIYGMGHAVYTKSDPRARICRCYAKKLAEQKGLGAEFALIERIETLAPEVMRDVLHTTKPICANIDLYTGFIYTMLDIPQALFTPLFAVARTAGWAAHRMEELFGAHRIIRPAYVSIMDNTSYTPLNER